MGTNNSGWHVTNTYIPIMEDKKHLILDVTLEGTKHNDADGLSYKFLIYYNTMLCDT